MPDTEAGVYAQGGPLHPDPLLNTDEALELAAEDIDYPTEGDAVVGDVSEVVDTETEPAPVAPHIVLELEGDRQLFRARAQKANQFLMVKYVDQLAQPGYPTTRAVTKLVLGQVTDAEQPRLERYLELHGYADDYDQALYDALDGCWRGETMLPFAPSSRS